MLDKTLNIDELPEGGMGIKLMWKLADELRYTRTPAHQNCLFIIKSYAQQTLNQSQSSQQDGRVLEQLIDMFNDLKLPKYKTSNLEKSDSPLQKLSLQVNTDLTALDRVLKWYEQLQDLPIPEHIWMQGQLAIAEGFTNAVRHAHKGLPLETPIRLEVAVFNERLEIKIWDYGQPFDLEARVKEFRQVNEKYSSFSEEVNPSFMNSPRTEDLTYTQNLL